jgi:hypothetical protein
MILFWLAVIFAALCLYALAICLRDTLRDYAPVIMPRVTRWRATFIAYAAFCCILAAVIGVGQSVRNIRRAIVEACLDIMVAVLDELEDGGDLLRLHRRPRVRQQRLRASVRRVESAGGTASRRNPRRRPLRLTETP